MIPRHAIVLAAGYGSRLNPAEGHKLLARIGDRRLLEHHAARFSSIGVDDLIVVTGFRGAQLADHTARLESDLPVRIRCIHNDDFDAGNGLSVLTGADALADADSTVPFWLTMSDHLFAPALFDDIVDRFTQVIDADTAAALLIDRKLDSIFDMPDANKVRLGSDFAIGKQLDDFDAVDTGLFWCRGAFVDALRGVRGEREDCTTSDAIRQLYPQGQFRFADIGDHLWQDVDTPEAREHAEQLWERWKAR